MAKTPATKTTRPAAKRKAPSLRVTVQRDIDQALAQAGITYAVDADGWRWMQDPKGEGLIGVVALVGERRDLTLRAVAPIMAAPKAQGALLKVLKKVAALNYDVVGHARLAVDNRTVWSIAAQNVDDIGPDDVTACIFDCLWLAQATAEALAGKKKPAKAGATK